MQRHYKACFIPEKLTQTELILRTEENEVLPSHPENMFGIAELVAGYMDCMQEALRYLKEVERYSEDHPAVLGLRQHLAIYQEQLIAETMQVKENIPTSQSRS